ncbi:NADH dehydrogenase [ubiquinone] 1 subunit C2-like isoform X2 [Ptychodera flava]|uniref:NADH dehydrogenase [ubiquinone] 1 subunit C2-like isoform X2 n=1 Tax=Ptychodera flava TaxID=63121 RepID=UPI003969FD53
MSLPDPNPVINRHTLAFGFFGLFSSIINNGMNRRPIISGLHRHIVAVAIGAALGYGMRRLEMRHWAERDWYIDDYINKHPQDFPEPNF